MFCSKETETVGHILWECPSTSDVWGVCGRGVQKMHRGTASFREELLQKILNDSGFQNL
jgi:hypothetical protein